MSDYLAGLVIVFLLYAVLSVSLNMLVGQAGLFSVAHALFFGVGAYATAIVMVKLHYGWPLSAVIGMATASLIGVLIAAISLRVIEDYLVIGSFGLQVIGTTALFNWTPLTGGVGGIAGVPLPTILGWTPSDSAGFVWMSLAVAAVGVGVIAILDRSPWGRILRATRDDPIACAALGKNPTTYKISAFVIAGALAAIAGSVYAAYRSFISPDDFTIDLSILLLAMVVVGGLDSIPGAIVGTALLVALPEVLRAVSLPPKAVGPAEQIAYGLLLIAFAALRPSGLIPAGTNPGRGIRRLLRRPASSVPGA